MLYVITIRRPSPGVFLAVGDGGPRPRDQPAARQARYPHAYNEGYAHANTMPAVEGYAHANIMLPSLGVLPALPASAEPLTSYLRLSRMRRLELLRTGAILRAMGNRRVT